MGMNKFQSVSKLTLFAAVLASACADNTTTTSSFTAAVESDTGGTCEYGKTGMWVRGATFKHTNPDISGALYNQGKRTALIEYCKQYGINSIALDMNWSNGWEKKDNNKNLLIGFLEDMHEANIKVEFFAGNPDWAAHPDVVEQLLASTPDPRKPDHRFRLNFAHTFGIDMLKRVIDFQNETKIENSQTVPAHDTFDAIRIAIPIHLSGFWLNNYQLFEDEENKNKNYWTEQQVALLEGLHKTLSLYKSLIKAPSASTNGTIPFIVDIPSFYASKAETTVEVDVDGISITVPVPPIGDKEIPTPEGQRFAWQAVYDIPDELSLVSFRDRSSHLGPFVALAMDYTKANNIPVTFGLQFGVSDSPSLDSSGNDVTTFLGDSLGLLNEVRNWKKNNFPNSQVRGFMYDQMDNGSLDPSLAPGDPNILSLKRFTNSQAASGQGLLDWQATHCAPLAAPDFCATECVDDDPSDCMEPVCDSDAETCEMQRIPDCCVSSDECVDTNLSDCQVPSCNLETNTCVFAEEAGCCDDNGDCAQEGDDGCIKRECNIAEKMCFPPETIPGCCPVGQDCSDDPNTPDFVDVTVPGNAERNTSTKWVYLASQSFVPETDSEILFLDICGSYNDRYAPDSVEIVLGGSHIHINQGMYEKNHPNEVHVAESSNVDVVPTPAGSWCPAPYKYYRFHFETPVQVVQDQRYTAHFRGLPPISYFPLITGKVFETVPTVDGTTSEVQKKYARKAVTGHNLHKMYQTASGTIDLRLGYRQKGACLSADTVGFDGLYFQRYVDKDEHGRDVYHVGGKLNNVTINSSDRVVIRQFHKIKYPRETQVKESVLLGSELDDGGRFQASGTERWLESQILGLEVQFYRANATEPEFVARGPWQGKPVEDCDSPGVAVPLKHAMKLPGTDQEITFDLLTTTGDFKTISVHGMSRNGTYIVGRRRGNDGGNFGGYLWTLATGAQNLDTLMFPDGKPADVLETIPLAVSNNGVVVGRLQKIGHSTGFVWSSTLNLRELKNDAFKYILATHVSADGSVVVGQMGANAHTDDDIFLWTVARIDPVAPISSGVGENGRGKIIALSNTGEEIIYSRALGTTKRHRLYRWTLQGGEAPMSEFNLVADQQAAAKGFTFVGASAISEDRTVVVGQISVGDFGQAFQWRAGTTEFVVTPGRSGIGSISGDGGVSTGSTHHGGIVSSVSTATLWGKDGTTTKLEDASWPFLTSVKEVSQDGLILAGEGTSEPFGGRAWIARYPGPLPGSVVKQVVAAEPDEDEPKDVEPGETDGPQFHNVHVHVLGSTSHRLRGTVTNLPGTPADFKLYVEVEFDRGTKTDWIAYNKRRPQVINADGSFDALISWATFKTGNYEIVLVPQNGGSNIVTPVFAENP